MPKQFLKLMYGFGNRSSVAAIFLLAGCSGVPSSTNTEKPSLIAMSQSSLVELQENRFVKYCGSTLGSEKISGINDLVEILDLKFAETDRVFLIRHSMQRCGLAFIPSRSTSYYKTQVYFADQFEPEPPLDQLREAYQKEFGYAQDINRISVYSPQNLAIDFTTRPSTHRPSGFALIDGEVFILEDRKS